LVYPWAGQDRARTAPKLTIKKGPVIFANVPEIRAAIGLDFNLNNSIDICLDHTHTGIWSSTGIRPNAPRISPSALVAFIDPTRKVAEDTRKNYGETRYNMLAKVNGRIFHITFTERGKIVWIISARKANKREQRRYEQG
jgi:uncharacterized DUF497 family protein